MNIILFKKVLDIIYEAKQHVQIPYIRIKIVNTKKNTLAYTFFFKNTIYISSDINYNSKNRLREVVLHEIVHTVKGIDHNEKCPLMRPHCNQKPISKKVAIEKFIQYMS